MSGQRALGVARSVALARRALASTASSPRLCTSPTQATSTLSPGVRAIPREVSSAPGREISAFGGGAAAVPVRPPSAQAWTTRAVAMAPTPAT